MGIYDDIAARDERKVVWAIELELDRCTLTYTQGLCTASDLGDGKRCHYTWRTCQVPSAFQRGTRSLVFITNGRRLYDNSIQWRPYLRRHVPVPQEIDPGKLDTFPEQLRVRMLGDFDPVPMDPDKGGGFYNTSTAGEFWRNLRARNTYVNRTMRVCRGFEDPQMPFSEFRQVGPDYLLKKIQVQEDGNVELTGESTLAELKDRQWPQTISEFNQLQVSVDAVQTTWTVLSADEFPDPNVYTLNRVYALAESEKVEILHRDTVANKLTVRRGALGTSAQPHVAGTELTQVALFGDDPGGTLGPTPQLVSEALLQLLEAADIRAHEINIPSFEAVDVIWTERQILRTIGEPEPIIKHLAELRENRGIAVYQDPQGLWSARVVAPAPATTPTVTVYQIEEGKTRIVEDEESRLTRLSLWYDPRDDQQRQASKHYRRAIVVVFPELEGPNEYQRIKDRLKFDPWLDPGVGIGVVRNMARRLVTRLRRGERRFEFVVDLIDDANVGDQLTVVIPEIVDVSGLPDARPTFIVARREDSESTVRISASDTNYGGQYLRISDDDVIVGGVVETWDNLTPLQRQYGTWGDPDDNRVGELKQEGSLIF